MKCPTKSAAYLRKFGITQKQYQALWNACDGRCPLCSKPFARSRRRLPVLDHDHVIGFLRGLICTSCNYDIGLRPFTWFDAVRNYLFNWPTTDLDILARHEDWRDR